jgi:hypothetical protein
MNHDIKGNLTPPEWPNYDGESIFMQDASFHTPCWRHWLNRQKVTGLQDMTWDELHERWADAFGAAEIPAPKNTSVAEIERLLHKPTRRRPAAHGRTRTSSSGSARLSPPSTAFVGSFYSQSKPS